MFKSRLFHKLFGALLVVALLSAGCESKSESPQTAQVGGNRDATGPITEARLGLKIYPGATMVTSGETDEIVSANLRTSDGAETVTKFYEAELGAKATGTPAAMTMSARKDGRTFAVSINESGGTTSISIMGKK